MNKKIVSTNIKSAVLLLSLSLFLGACAKKAQEIKYMPPMPVVLAAAEQKDAFRFIDTLGTTSSLKSVTIIPQVSGELISVNFQQGQYVKAGDIIAVIDKRQYEARVLAAKAQIAQADAKLKIDQLAVERNKKLAESKYVDKQTYDTLVATVESDKAALEAAKADLELAQINLDWCTIKAPISGKIGFYKKFAGDILTANTSLSEITDIEQQDSLFVDFIIPTHRQHEVKTLMEKNGGKLELEVAYLENGYTDNKIKATVSIFDSKARYQSSTIIMRGILDNKDGKFYPDQSVKVRLDTDPVKGGIFIPDSALQNDLVGSFVYIADKAEGALYKVRKQYVKTIQLYPGGKYLLEGVKAGEKVLTAGQLMVAETSYVYSADKNGIPLDADDKPIDPKDMGKFIGENTQLKARLDAADKAKSALEAEASKEETAQK